MIKKEDMDNLVENKKPEEVKEGVNRRSFMQIMGASAALASMGGCLLRRPVEYIVPYGETLPENVVLGRPLQFATSFSVNGDVQGLLVESYEGRPTKIEGLPGHPNNDGKTNSVAQAHVLELYDPDRSFSPYALEGGKSKRKKFADFEKAWKKIKEDLGPDATVAVLADDVNSKSFAAGQNQFYKAFGNAQWYSYAPVNKKNVEEGTDLAFGEGKLNVITDYSKADVILSLDCDFLGTEPGSVKATREFTSNRDIESPQDKLNRLYSVESRFSLTGAKADHRIAMPSAQVKDFALALAKEFGISEFAQGQFNVAPENLKRAEIIAKDLKQKGTKSLIVAGANQPAIVHAIVAALNESLRSSAVSYTHTCEYDYNNRDNFFGTLEELVASVKAGEVDALLFLDTNPVYNAPADLKVKDVFFNKADQKVKYRLHYGLYLDETASLCDWHVNAAHALESWGDWQAPNGHVSLQQPLIEPLTQVLKDSEKIGSNDVAYSRAEFLYKLTGENKSGYEILKEAYPGVNLKKAIHFGVIKGKEFKAVKAPVRLRKISDELVTIAAYKEDGIEVVFATDNSIVDGRYANNAWLQELPDPMTKVAWDNPVTMSYATAKELKVENGDIITIKTKSGEAKGAVFLLPGQAPKSVTLNLGYGRDFNGEKGVVARGIGFDYYTLRSSKALSFESGATITTANEDHTFANSQIHGVQEGRDLAKKFDIKSFARDPKRSQRNIEREIPPEMKVKFAHVKDMNKESRKLDRVKSLSQDQDYSEGYQWGMTIDLTKCTSCATCTVACQSENNIPVVGQVEMQNGREMHWIRMDRYFTYDGQDTLQYEAETLNKDLNVGRQLVDHTMDDSKVGVSTMPVACQHCENAPCEQVCPVAATVHSPEGLNDMAYNRCIGTRYCANNCPYKVRRYNFYHWTRKSPWTTGDSQDKTWTTGEGWKWDIKAGYGNLDKLDKLQPNPHVTVRSRGVMEKCTFCVQRINVARMDAKGQGKTLSDKEGTTPVPACAQACPADAITFGDINDKDSKVSKKRALDHSYQLLEAINTKPRTSYISAITNPNLEWV